MKEKIRAIMAVVFEVDLSDIDEQTTPAILDSWDSIRHMNLITALEEEFEIEFPADQIPDLLNLNIIYLCVLEEIGKTEN